MKKRQEILLTWGNWLSRLPLEQTLIQSNDFIHKKFNCNMALIDCEHWQEIQWLPQAK